jgi:hypothetical protein
VRLTADLLLGTVPGAQAAPAATTCPATAD